MNRSLYKAAAQLTSEQIAELQGAFFGSILGTLNHIVVGDTIWLARFTHHPKKYTALDVIHTLPHPTGLDQILYPTFSTLRSAREHLDQIILQWCDELECHDFQVNLEYADTKGIVHRHSFGSLIQHFFNHQTHHRGQVTTLLNQCGIDVGVTDLLKIIPEIPS